MSRIRFIVDHHGVSGTWYEYSQFNTLTKALDEAVRLKNDGYGVRVMARRDGTNPLDQSVLIVNAPWQKTLNPDRKQCVAYCLSKVGTVGEDTGK